MGAQWNPKDLMRSNQAIKQWFKHNTQNIDVAPSSSHFGSPPEWLWEIDKFGNEARTHTTASIVPREIGGS